jgi:NAD+ synthase (glutamine-hydrolysing)
MVLLSMNFDNYMIKSCYQKTLKEVFLVKNFGFVKCAIATLNGNLSNPSSNTAKIISLIKQAEEKDVKILVFPELSLTGYTCQDLFGNEQLLDETMKYLEDLVKYSADKDILFVVGAPVNVDDTLYNCAVVIQKGAILGVVPKQYLPNYNEFYEKRWFSPYIDFSKKDITLFGISVPFGNLIFESSLGYKFGIEICEDLWAVIPPSSYLALEGCNIIANLSASNELVGKDDYRKDLVKNQSARTMSAYIYVSAGFSESTSDIVFGGSGYAFENGKELVCLQRFQMTDIMKVFDVDVDYLSGERRTNKTYSDNKRCSSIPYTTVSFEQETVNNFELSRFVNPHPFIPNIVDEAGGRVCKEIFDIQSTALARRLTSIKNTCVTIGVSGGLDSTLALIVCYETFKRLNLDQKGIIAITMPGFGTTNRTKNNAALLCDQMGVTLKEISIKDACLQHFNDIGHDDSVHDITYENVQARERTLILMDMANKYHGIVIGTGDLSELALGWSTYNGDHMSMYNVNCSIP